MGINELHLLHYIYLNTFFGVTNTLRVYLKMGTFTLTQVKCFVKKLLLLLRYCGRRASRYFILLNAIQVKNASIYCKCAIYFSTGQWAMPICEWFILLIKPVCRIGLRISLNYSFSSLLHALSRQRAEAGVRKSRVLSAAARNLFQEECFCLDTININIFIIVTLAEI